MKIFFAIAMSLTVLTSCSLVPEYMRPDTAAKEGWSRESAEAKQISQDWWRNFSSDELNAFMATALEKNNDLQASLQRIEQSRAAIKIAGADLLPGVTASAGSSQGRVFDNNRTSSSNDLNTGLNVAYEVDLFGANRAGVSTARANFYNSQFTTEALRLVVMGDVSNAYFNVLTAKVRLAVADKNLTAAKEVQRIIQAQFEAGRASALVVAQQNSAVASAEASRASIVNLQTASENALAVLLGQAPQTLAISGQDFSGLTIPAIAAGQPSELLQKRPDIRAAEMSLVAANANIGIARATYYPNLTLGVGANISTGDASSQALSLASNLVAPIFQGGRIEGGVEQATARQKELVEIYRKTVLTAFQEVEDALADERAAWAREQALDIAQTEAQKSYNLSKSLYEAGSIDFQTLLDSQRVLLQAQDSYVQSKLERLAAAISLFKSLGGGWQEQDS